MKIYQNLFLSLIFMLLLVGLAACGTIPAGKFQALESAGDQIQTTSADTFLRIENLQRLIYVIRANKLTEIGRDTFSVPKDLDLSPDLKYRAQKIETMVSYLRLLNSLASKDFASDVDKASQDLAASTQTLLATAGQKADEAKQVAGIFGTVIDAVARAAVTKLRRDILRESMQKGQPGIDALAKTFQGSSKLLQQAVATYKDNYLVHVNATRPKTLNWQLNQIDSEIANRMSEFNAVVDSLQGIEGAIGKIPAAHREVLHALDDPTKASDELKALLAEAKRIRGFYKNLTKN